MNLEKCIGIKLVDIKDLARFTATLASAAHPIYIVHFIKNGKHVYGLLATLRDYYKLYGIPLFYYVILDKPLNRSYILVKLDSQGEKIVFCNKMRPGWIHIPIINFEKPPTFLLESIY